MSSRHKSKNVLYVVKPGWFGGHVRVFLAGFAVPGVGMLVGGCEAALVWPLTIGKATRVCRPPQEAVLPPAGIRNPDTVRLVAGRPAMI